MLKTVKKPATPIKESIQKGNSIIIEIANKLKEVAAIDMPTSAK